MKIGALSAQTGLSCSRIRYYERIGLLKAVEPLPNGYRIYLDEAVLILKLIVVAQEAGFTLEEMQRLIPPDLGSWDHDLLARTLAAKIAEIDAQQAQLARAKARLLTLAEGLTNRPSGMDCAANTARVMALIPADIGKTAGDGDHR